MRLWIICLLFCSAVSYGGAAFESDNYLIWISSRCEVQSKTCKDVAYNQIDKKSGKTITIHGGEPIVGTLSGNLIGYNFQDTKNNHAFEISMDLSGDYVLYIRGFSRVAQKEKLKRISDSVYQNKLTKIKIQGGNTNSSR